MSPLAKIIIGALGSTALIALLHNALGWNANCAIAAPAPAIAAPVVPENVAEPVVNAVAPATTEQVANCQTAVDTALKSGTINFSSDGAVIAAASFGLLDSIATELKGCAGTVVEVAGHTDLQGDAAYNLDLSQRRAAAVVAALGERGVPAASLVAKGLGETQPIEASGPENNPVNRRIEFNISSSAPAPAAN